MRDSLTVIAILLIAVLTTALIGPYFVDWNAHRAAIEGRLSTLAGAPVTIRGPIDLKLLPKPVFRFGSVAIGAVAGGPYGTIPGRQGAAQTPRLTADEVDAELSLPAMLRGQIQVVDATLRDPHLDLEQAADGSVALPGLPAGDADRVAIEHLGVRGGTLAVRLADGRRLAVAGIDLDGDATTLRGPFKARGSVGGLPIRLATGAIEAGHMRVKLGIDPAEGRPALDLDGTLTLAGGPFAFDGMLAGAGALPLAGTPATVPWRATARTHADASAATLTEVEIRAGDDLRALIADGTGTVSRGAGADAVAAVALKLHGAGLDLDGLAVAPKDGAIAAPQGVDLLKRLIDAAGERAGQSTSPVRLTLEGDVDTATIAGRTLLGATLRLGLGPEAGVAVAVSTAGPDGIRLSLDGQVTSGPAFRGRADVATTDLSRAGAWLKPISPDLAGWLVANLPARSIVASGEVEASDERLVLRPATLRLDGSRLTGSLAYDRAARSGRPKLTADLTTESLDLDGFPDLGRISVGEDLDLALAAPAVRLSGAALGSAGSSVSGGPLAFHLMRTGDDLDLDRFSLAVGGATVAATGSRAGSNARIEAHVDAPQLGPIATIVARLLPNPATAAFVTHAAALSPFVGTLRAEASVQPDGAPMLPTRLTLEGTAAGTHLAATLVPERADAEGASRSLALSVDASAPDAASALRQLGLAAARDGAIGPGQVHVTAHGSLAAGFTVAAQTKLGGMSLAYDGRVDSGRGGGTLTLSAADLRPLLAGLGVGTGTDGEPARAEGHGSLDWSDARLALGGISAQVAGTSVAGDLVFAFGAAQAGHPVPGLSGHLSLDRLPAAALLALGLGAPTKGAPAATTWSPAPFGPPPPLPPGEVTLEIARMPFFDALEARDAAVTLKSTRNGLALADGSAKIAGGAIDGAGELRRDGASATLSAHLAWHDLAIDLGDLSGRAGGDVRFAGAGMSPATLVADVGGTGTLAVGSAALARTDPEAPSRTAAAFTVKDPLADPDPRGLDAAAVGKRIEDELDHGPLRFGRQSVPLVLAAGVLQVAPLKPDGAGGASRSDAALDLRDLTISLRTRLDAANQDGGPGAPGEVDIAETGPLGGPLRRQVDSAGLVMQLQAQAVSRAQERIDVIEQDIRERAYFNRQLKAIQADQQAARERAAAETAAARSAAAARRADAAKARADDARLQADVEAAARADAAKAEADRRRFIERQVQGFDGAAVDPARAGGAAPTPRRHHARPHDPLELAAPPSILQDKPPAVPRP